MWTGQGPRERRRDVQFSEPYRTAPAVHVAISMWDTDHDSNQRAEISAANISETGFTAVFRTWGDSRVARVRVGWLAIGELHGDEDWEIT